jgi:hypothetical protein
VVTKPDRLARSLPDARDIADELTRRQVKLNLGGTVIDPTDPVGRLLFNVLAMVAEFEADLIRMRTREGMKLARAKGRLRGKQPQAHGTPGTRTWCSCTAPGAHERRAGRAVRRRALDGVPGGRACAAPPGSPARPLRSPERVIARAERGPA